MAEEGFKGMPELIRALEKLPKEISGEAANIVHETANSMALDVRTEYPYDDGQLRSGVIVEEMTLSQYDVLSTGRTLRWKVRSKAPHAHLYEYGTVERFHNRTGKSTGTMPAKPTFIPIAQRHRRRMFERLSQLLRRARVTGMTGSMDLVES